MIFLKYFIILNFYSNKNFIYIKSNFTRAVEIHSRLVQHVLYHWEQVKNFNFLVLGQDFMALAKKNIQIMILSYFLEKTYIVGMWHF